MNKKNVNLIDFIISNHDEFFQKYKKHLQQISNIFFFWIQALQRFQKPFV